MQVYLKWNYWCYLRTVPTNSEVFLRGLLNMREKQISLSVIKIQKENWAGNHALNKDN